MVKNTIQLKSEASVLSLSTGENNMCEVSLQYRDLIYQLGVEDQAIVVARLQAGLCKNEFETIGELEGIPVAWVLSLAEIHTTLYVGIEAGARHLFFQNQAGETFAKLSLSPETCQNWLQLLNLKP